MKFNDVLAFLLILVVIPGLWLAQGADFMTLPGEVNGVLLSGWTLVVQYYFRKKPGEAPSETPSK
ncbi:hypothetical protein [Dehalococcoides mccartyi]|nr:hypothetical protein [Dehalococcoides mccartyi]